MTDAPSISSNDDILSLLRRSTPARLGIGRRGPALPTAEVLNLALAHARARDAVNADLDIPSFLERLAALQLEHCEVQSQAENRSAYIRDPELGRRLSADSRASLLAREIEPRDVAIVVADGLSAVAIDQNCIPLLQSLIGKLRDKTLSLCPIVVAAQGRVALGDEIGEILQARLVLVLIGERPGLTSIDSIGAYLTFAPKIGIQDASRNCVSNIRPAGMTFDVAADKLCWLMTEALRRRETGVGLKDVQHLGTESHVGAIEASGPILGGEHQPELE